MALLPPSVSAAGATSLRRADLPASQPVRPRVHQRRFHRDALWLHPAFELHPEVVSAEP